MTDQELAPRPVRRRRPRSAIAVAAIIVAALALGMAACTAVLAGASAAYDARPRAVGVNWFPQHFVLGPEDAYGDHSCRPTGADAELAAGTRLVLMDTRRHRLAVGRIDVGHSVTADSCFVSGVFLGRVAVHDTYLLQVGARPPIRVHPDREDLCDPDANRYPDTLALEEHPPIGCGG